MVKSREHTFSNHRNGKVLNRHHNSPQNNKSSVHNSPVNVDSTIKNESQITFLENTSTIMNIEPQTSSMKELSSSNHPTHSSTNIETEISPVNVIPPSKETLSNLSNIHSSTHGKNTYQASTEEKK